MSCVTPYEIQVRGEKQKVNCGRCMNCRIKKQSELIFIANKEVLQAYKEGKGCSFVTLTYSDEFIPFIHLPTHNIYRGLHNLATVRNEVYFTLYRKDVSDFIKRVRRSFEYHKMNVDFKTIYCGEFGSKTDRPHYHIVFIGLTDTEAILATRHNWPYGICDVGPLSAGGIRYVTKYLIKSQSYDKSIKALYSHCCVQGPFLYHSINFSNKWKHDNLKNIENKSLLFLQNGKQRLFPKNVLDYYKYRTGNDFSKDINDYFQNNIVKQWKLKQDWQCFDNYEIEQNIIREKQLINSARSKGLNVNPIFMEEHKWLKPNTMKDRIPIKKEKWFEPYKSIWFEQLKQEGKTISEIAKIFNNFQKNY